MANSIDSVLYGPSIEFLSDEWLKCSLLLWDSVYRIVPTTCRPNDSHAVILAKDSGLVREVTLEKEDLSATYAEFLDFVKDVPFTPAGLTPHIERVHEEKIDARLYPLLEAMAVRVDPEGWLSLPAELARGYMLYLAKTVSGRRNLATATDSVDEWAIMPYFKEEANFDERLYYPEAQGFYSFMMFSDVLPSRLESIEMKRVIEFAAARKDEKARLRKVLQEFSESIGTCKSQSHAASLVADYETQIKQAKKDFAGSMDFYDAEQGFSLLTVGLPIALGIFQVFGGKDPFNLLNIASSVFIGAIASYWQYSKVEQVMRKESYASYLVEIDRSLKGDSRVTRADRILEEFIND
jgi:hypothetical protein